MKENTLSETLKIARLNWQQKHGKCSACRVGDQPVNGLHQGVHKCGNYKPCSICAGVLPYGEQCRACFRIQREA